LGKVLALAAGFGIDEAAPARSIAPFAAAACGVVVDGDEYDIARAEFFADGIDAAAAFLEGYVHIFRDDALGIIACGFETGYELRGYLTGIFPFKQSLVGAALARRIVTVTVVD